MRRAKSPPAFGGSVSNAYTYPDGFGAGPLRAPKE
jgi:hypothetical protein